MGFGQFTPAEMGLGALCLEGAGTVLCLALAMLGMPVTPSSSCITELGQEDKALGLHFGFLSVSPFVLLSLCVVLSLLAFKEEFAAVPFSAAGLGFSPPPLHPLGWGETEARGRAEGGTEADWDPPASTKHRDEVGFRGAVRCKTPTAGRAWIWGLLSGRFPLQD